MPEPDGDVINVRGGGSDTVSCGRDATPSTLTEPTESAATASM